MSAFNPDLSVYIKRVDTRSLPRPPAYTSWSNAEFETSAKQFIVKQFLDKHIGKVKRVDLVSKKTPEGYTFYSAWIVFDMWFNNHEVISLQTHILQGNSVKFQFHKKWFWNLIENRKRDQSPLSLQKVVCAQQKEIDRLTKALEEMTLSHTLPDIQADDVAYDTHHYVDPYTAEDDDPERDLCDGPMRRFDSEAELVEALESYFCARHGAAASPSAMDKEILRMKLRQAKLRCEKERSVKDIELDDDPEGFDTCHACGSPCSKSLGGAARRSSCFCEQNPPPPDALVRQVAVTVDELQGLDEEEPDLPPPDALVRQVAVTVDELQGLDEEEPDLPPPGALVRQVAVTVDELQGLDEEEPDLPPPGAVLCREM